MKEKLFKKGLKRRLFRVVLALAMVVTLMPMNSMSVHAASYENDKIMYSIPRGMSKGWYYVNTANRPFVYTPLAVGDELTSCKYQESETANIYVNGTLVQEGGSVAGKVVKINEDYLYICSASAHESNKDTTTGLCPNCDPDTGAHTPKSQPKTGVMDTLPMWFGVMAVSAAAYVLTSKKRFF